MTDLIRRLEEATEGSRELDAEIAVAAEIDLPSPMGDAKPWLKVPTPHDNCAPGTYWLVQRSGMSLRTAPPFSTSIDAALTLIPEGYSLWRINQYHTPNNPAWAWGVHLRHHADPETGMVIGETDVSMPFSMCIAALKARQS